MAPSSGKAGVADSDEPQAPPGADILEFVFSVPQFQAGDSLRVPAPDGTRLKLRLPKNAKPGDRMFMAKNDDGDWVIKRISRPPASSRPPAAPGSADDAVEESPSMPGRIEYVGRMSTADDIPEPDVTSIMCLGDSHTHGYHHQGGYRIHLWELMQKAGWKVRFVGNLRNGPKTIDRRHEGWPGYTLDELTNGRGEDIDINLQRDLARYAPDIILLMIGSNDVIQEIDLPAFGQRMQRLLNLIQSQLPNVKVVLANLPNVRGMEAIVQTVNQQFPEVEKASTRSGLWLQLIEVNSLLGVRDFHDSAHLNIRGFRKVARAFFKVLEEDVLGADACTEPKRSARGQEQPRRRSQRSHSPKHEAYTPRVQVKKSGSAPARKKSRSRSPTAPESSVAHKTGTQQSASPPSQQIVQKTQGDLAHGPLVSCDDDDARRREQAAREDILKRMQAMQERNSQITRAKAASDQDKKEAARISELEKSVTAQFAAGDYISGLEDDELACTIS